MDVTRSMLGRFWRKVREEHRGFRSRCWIWTGSVNPKGYGKFNIGANRPRLAHRVAWYFEHGRWPDDALCHDCDVPACVRPSHMWEGSRTENNDDMRRKGRGSDPPVRLGEANNKTKLSAGQVREIRALWAAGASQRALARQFAVSRTNVKSIIQRKTWRHI